MLGLEASVYFETTSIEMAEDRNIRDFCVVLSADGNIEKQILVNLNTVPGTAIGIVELIMKCFYYL